MMMMMMLRHASSSLLASCFVPVLTVGVIREDSGVVPNPWMNFFINNGMKVQYTVCTVS